MGKRECDICNNLLYEEEDEDYESDMSEYAEVGELVDGRGFLCEKCRTVIELQNGMDSSSGSIVMWITIESMGIDEAIRITDHIFHNLGKLLHLDVDFPSRYKDAIKDKPVIMKKGDDSILYQIPLKVVVTSLLRGKDSFTSFVEHLNSRYIHG